MKMLLLALVIISAPVDAQTLFSMNASAAAEPNAGFDTVSGASELGVVVNRARVSGAGPSGQDAYRFTFRHDATQLSAGQNYGGEHYLGWAVTAGAAPSAGQSRFGRLRFRVASGSNFEALNSADGSGAATIHKIVILGDGNRGRTILSVVGDPSTRRYEMRLGIDGGAEIQVPNLLPGTWYDVQWESVTSTTSTGMLKLWVDNDVYASPTGRSTGSNTQPGAYNYVSVGFYNNRMIAANGAYGFDLADFVYAASFDPSWNSATAPPPPPPPTPVDCVVSPFAFSSATPWSACEAGTQTRSETWTRTVVTQPANGGTSCPALAELRGASQPCAAPPAAVFYCEVRAIPGSYADGDIRRTIRCDTNGPATLPIGTTFTIPRP